MITENLLECFVTAAECLNFTAAAEKVHITQPAFSRNIATLEQEFGFPLFWRNKQSGLRITAAGLEMYNAIKEMDKNFRMHLDRARGISRGEVGRLVIAVLNGFCLDSEMFTRINDFKKKYPSVDVELRSCIYADLLGSIESGKSDICITLDPGIIDKQNILHEDLYTVESYMAVPSSLNCDTEVVHKLDEFKDEFFILSEDSPQLNRFFVEECRNAGFEPKTKIAPDSETKMLWVEAGQGLAVNSKEHYLKDSKFVDFVLVEELKPVGYVVAWDKANYNPAISLFITMFSDEIDE